MAKWAKQSGVDVYVPAIPLYLHERTRKWYVRLERANAGAQLSAKVYAIAGDANAGNANYSGIGSVTVNSGTLKVVLAAGPQSPSLAGAILYIEVPGDLALAIGTAVWRVDIGKKIRRATLWVLRAFSKISEANGYFTTFGKVERGFRTEDEVSKAPSLMPYLGIGTVKVTSTPKTLGGHVAGSLDTKLAVRCVAYQVNRTVALDDVSDPDTDYIYDDIRRAMETQYREAWSGLQDDGVPIVKYELLTGDPDLGMIWARPRGSIEFEIELTLDENGLTEVATP